MTVIDLFGGGLGGWDRAARELELDPLGIELDPASVATRRACGLRTLHADVAALDPASLGTVTGVIASPPCPTFSSGGKGSGNRELERVLELIADLGDGVDSRLARRDELADADGALFGFAHEDPRTLLVAEPLRYALELEPEWIALEQVPSVLPVWEAIALVLARHGYSVDTGVLRAEEYGVPQTRERAILVASRTRRATLPRPTHNRYRKGTPADAGELLPWVSMRDAVGWDAEERVGFPRLNDRLTDDAPRLADDDGKYRARDLRRGDEPAFTLTEKARSWTRFGAIVTGSGTAPRALDEPSPTVTGQARVWSRREVLVDTGNTRGGTRPYGRVRSVEEPAPTITSRADQLHRREQEADATSGVPLTIDEAAVLQGFPRGLPVQGTRSSAFLQIGNAVPPPLARAVLEEAIA